MPERRLPMRQIKEVLRLHYEAHLSERQIAHGCRISRSTVQRYLERAAAANLGWPLPESMDDTQLERLLFSRPPIQEANGGRPPVKTKPDFAKIHQELKANKSVTLQLLWQEFIEQHPDGARSVGSASSTTIGHGIWMWCCDRITAPAKGPLSIMPATPSW